MTGHFQAVSDLQALSLLPSTTVAVYKRAWVYDQILKLADCADKTRSEAMLLERLGGKGGNRSVDQIRDFKRPIGTNLDRRKEQSTHTKWPIRWIVNDSWSIDRNRAVESCAPGHLGPILCLQDIVIACADSNATGCEIRRIPLTPNLSVHACTKDGGHTALYRESQPLVDALTSRHLGTPTPADSVSGKGGGIRKLHGLLLCQ